jgi:hypothetical protein
MDLIRQINTSQHLYLDKLVELNDLEVEFWIREAGSLGQGGEEVSTTSYSPIVSGPDSRLYRILFEGYIAYSVFNESFEKLPRAKALYSRLFQVIPTSDFLDYVAANADISYAEAISDQKPRHFRLNCLNHVIDIATCFEPSIEVVGIMSKT